MIETFHTLSTATNKGTTLDFATLRGRPVLVVNTASKCGLTPQYKGLQKLYDDYQAKGLEILGFPCSQFANQEPGNDADIASFCSLNYGVTFPLAAKTSVNGPETHPVFAWLKKKSAGLIHRLLGTDIKWNFTKFLVSPDGKTVRRFGPQVDPASIAPHIEAMLTGSTHAEEAQA